MNLEAGINLGQLLIALVALGAPGLIVWGGLLQRVRVLEKEVEKIADFAVRLARIESEIGHINTGIGRVEAEVGKITSSWLLTEPPSYVSTNPRPRRRNS